MITDAILTAVSALTRLVLGVLPDSTLDLPNFAGIGEWMGEKAGPLDRFFPVSELATGLVLIVGVWMPAAATYIVVNWIYRHLPVVGAG